MLDDEQKKLLLEGKKEESLQCTEQEKKLIHQTIENIELYHLKEELNASTKTKKELIADLMTLFKISKDIAQKIRREDFSKLPVTVSVFNTEKTLESIYSLARAESQTPNEIVNRIEFSASEDLSNKVKLLYHEAVGVHEKYLHEVVFAGRLHGGNEWSGYYAGVTGMGVTSYVALSFFFAGWGVVPTLFAATIGGIATGLPVRYGIGQFENWLNKKKIYCKQQEAIVTLGKERDRKIDQLQQELSSLLFHNE